MNRIIDARTPALLGAAILLLACGGEGFAPEVFPELVITTESLESAVRGRTYANAVNANGGDGAYAWDIATGALPAGLTLLIDDLGEDDAILAGIPEVEGVFAFTVRVVSGDGQSDTRQFSLEVLPDVPVAIETSAVPPALVGAPYNVGLFAYGGDLSYEWSMVEGSLPAGLGLTALGRIMGTPQAADTARFTVEVQSAGLTDRISYVLPVVPNRTTTFNITLFPLGDIPESMWPHLDSAVAQWERAITGNLPTVTVPTTFFQGGQCGGVGNLVNGTTAEDLLIIVQILPIDGPRGVLGRAGPCGVRSTSRLPFVGTLLLDSEDLLPRAGDQWVTHIISHEIGHVIGFGTLWDEEQGLDLLEGEGTTNPRFTGTHAVEEYQALGGSGNVPVENQGLEGTRDSHWRQSIFGNERMTGFAAQPGVFQPLSRVSVASIRDLGYTVDMAAADDYSLTSALMAPGPDGPHSWGDAGYDEVIRGPFRELEP